MENLEEIEQEIKQEIKPQHQQVNQKTCTKDNKEEEQLVKNIICQNPPILSDIATCNYIKNAEKIHYKQKQEASRGIFIDNII